MNNNLENIIREFLELSTFVDSEMEVDYAQYCFTREELTDLVLDAMEYAEIAEVTDDGC